MHCRVCDTPIEPFMSFGRMPIANGFLAAKDFASEYFFELAPSLCGRCGMVQLIQQPAPERMFHDQYAFFSGTSRYMARHFAAFAEDVRGRILTNSDPFVVEIGSNDGILLRNFAEKGIRHLGIEPSENVAAVARSAGVQTLSLFFSEATARNIVAKHGHADAVLAANVLCHIPEINQLAAGIRTLLKPDGLLVFEDPYLGDMVEKTSYDQIYDEHVFIFSATSVSNAFRRHGLELVDVEPQVTHGGSMRYFLAPAGRRQPSSKVAAMLARERALGLSEPAAYLRFRANCEASRSGLMKELERFRREGKRVVGYGATSKSTTVTNYCGITPDHVAFISDTTPLKQGKFSPGAHIPVRPYEAFEADRPPLALLFAWNHKKEILAKEAAFAAAGGRWIEYVPTVTVTSAAT